MLLTIIIVIGLLAFAVERSVAEVEETEFRSIRKTNEKFYAAARAIVHTTRTIREARIQSGRV